ncbi:MAG TPA: dTDP-4-dehydrorhamnose 3,5-epimerase [Saprospiraceae bacterium]|nr:dTDP-4-dehydrorhamnose 3,5-epimerase [Saprospiraceae bacterium]MCB9270438.1 dTDP-4-dehydrorhamnose 3,5-epimerase [Lewinellaceae bacterium]HPG07442.1 dTDP-4-dehydrorhamnose 3,5-epimerase [Saprospiraceae bacterium]HPR00313.1 dTDP-4-dehydrorhamnose 3,5-epimerase [Saprospiraceae bacterium]HQU52624.1 dTDP-4-dehydrorhamnose 3,5-epimerase [Saprospiraceae bacterium]
MQVIETDIPGVLILEPRVFADHRGYFFESYNRLTLEHQGLQFDFCQDNEARSEYGVLRGLHYQIGEAAQTKLVRVIEGEVLDVAVDIRPGSATYGKHVAVRLSAENKRQLLVPKGFAHGYVVLSPTAIFSYKCDAFYAKQAEGGIHYADPELNINWLVPVEKITLSEKDQILPPFGKHRHA